jgi:hypothetical protein
MDVDFENLGSERRHEVLRESSILILHGAWELRRITEAGKIYQHLYLRKILYIPMEKTAEGGIRPLLRLPPFTAFPLILVLRDSVLWDLQIDKLEK